MKKKILAIDDSKAIRFLLQSILGKDYQVITMADHCSAMYWLNKQNIPDLFVIDPQLPDMENWELVKYVASNGMYRNIPVMVLSALDHTQTRLKCFEYGVNEFYMKPFDPSDVMYSINALLKRQPFDHFFNAN